mmetsp:Transcript_10926/g.18705  ORF Transcript_10926/g.18705 Transcript_10926/m.18705 type:complete len:226 (+) Transcript_10926:523-1200(+)
MRATGVRLMRLVTSPTAQTQSTVVRLNSSTLTAPSLFNSTPTSFRPRSGRLVFGDRPVANITISHSTIGSPASSVRDSLPLAIFSILTGFVLACTCTPRLVKFSPTALRTSSSKPRRGVGWRYTMWVSVPEALKMPANSTAMNPPPSTTTFLGTSSIMSASSEVMPSSAPGMFSLLAVPPVAIRMWAAVTLLTEPSGAVTCTVWLSKSLPEPTMLATLALESIEP